MDHMYRDRVIITRLEWMRNVGIVLYIAVSKSIVMRISDTLLLG